MNIPLLPAHAGEAHANDLSSLLGQWSLDPLVVIGLLALAALYVAGWRRLRRRSPRHAGVLRLAAFLGGIVVLWLALSSPVDPIAEEYLLTAHMVQHGLIIDVAPLLLMLGLAGPLSLFAVPARPLARAARAPRLRRIGGALARPSTALVVWLAAVVTWHVPAAYQLALDQRWAHDLEHLSFLAAGLLLWFTIVSPLPGHRPPAGRRAATAGAVLLAGMLIAQVLVASGPLYDTYAEQPERLFGLSPAEDQVRAGLVMSFEQVLTVGTAALLLFFTQASEVAKKEARASSAPRI